MPKMANVGSECFQGYINSCENFPLGVAFSGENEIPLSGIKCAIVSQWTPQHLWASFFHIRGDVWRHRIYHLIPVIRA